MLHTLVFVAASFVACASVSARYRTPGIIGGMEPSATCDLMQKVIDNTAAQDDQHHIHLLVYPTQVLARAIVREAGAPLK